MFLNTLIDGALITEGGKLFHWLIMQFVKQLDLISFDLDVNNLKLCPLVKVVDDIGKKLTTWVNVLNMILNVSIKSPLCLCNKRNGGVIASVALHRVAYISQGQV